MEEWKVLTGYYNNYEVSRDGEIRNVKTGRIMKQWINDKGYKYVTLSNKSKRKHFQVHRLVATMFIPNPHNLPVVNHKDRNPLNNCVENLEWCTQKYNVEYSHNVRVRCIETGKVYDNIRQAEEETGIHNGNISKVCRGERKSCGGLHFEYVD